MTYDGNQLKTRTDPSGLTLTYGYDDIGNVTSVSDSAGATTSFVFDGGRVVRKTYQDGTNELRVDFAYDDNGNLQTETRFSDLAGTQLVGTTEYSYDGNRLMEIVYKDSTGAVIGDFSYTYDDAERLASETDNGTTTNYGYDATSQLTQDGSTAHTYDAAGNPTASGDVTTTGNRLESDGTWNYTYDAVGNLVGKSNISTGETWDYTYDNANHMTSAVQKDNTGAVLNSVDYTYDVFGDRISQAVNGTMTKFVYDDSRTLYADKDGSGNVVTHYLTDVGGPNHWLARVDGSGSAWLLSDHLGSVRVVTDAAGSVLSTISYDAFGNTVSESAPTQTGRLKFQGGEFDTTTGLYHFGDRWYDPATQRWTSQDPIGFGGGDENLYRFVHNAPTLATDPTGLREADDRETTRTKPLVDVSKILEDHVNQVIQKAWRDSQQAGDDAAAFAKRVYDALGADEPGSEVTVTVTIPYINYSISRSFSPIAKIGVWLDTNLKENSKQIVKLTFAESRYGDNALRGMAKAIWKMPWLYNQETADHGIAPTIRIKDVLMGTDKWEHFFQQGYWTFDAGMNEKEAKVYSFWLEGVPSARGRFMESHPELQKEWGILHPSEKHERIDNQYKRISSKFGVKTWMGIYGSESTGVVSYADINANLEGLKFYKKLVNAYQKGQKSFGFVFSVNDYKFQDFNEQREENVFLRGLQVNDSK
jgi:RHS repeat-associated protein